MQDLRNLLSLKRRLKSQEHGYQLRIRNHLLAKYFPELDRYYEQSETTALAIINWCLDPSEIAGLAYKEFVQRVSLKRGQSFQEKRLQAIWKMTVESVGCEAGPAVEFEAQVMFLPQKRKIFWFSRYRWALLVVVIGIVTGVI